MDTTDDGSPHGATNGSQDASPILYFHTGIHKTGSTALQVFFAANAERLRASGISYAYPPSAPEYPGNGQYLQGFLNKRSVTTRRIDDLLALYLDGQRAAIISSEDFTFFGPAEWQQIADSASRLGARVRIFTYLRNVAPYYRSAHAQLIKDGCITATFGEYCNRESDVFARVVQSLQCMQSIFGRVAMWVFQYADVVGEVEVPMLAALGLDGAQLDRSALRGKRINRSLTEYEQTLVARVTKAASRQFAMSLASFLMVRNPDLAPTGTVPEEILALLGERHAADVQWINNTFFAGQGVARIADASRGNGHAKELSTEDRLRIDEDVVAWCIDNLKTAQDESVEFMIRRLREIDWENAGNPAVPNDFDPIAYLAQNTDLMRSNVPPYRHFIDVGHREVHRKWRWTA